jgi:hypothetical protein
VRAIGKERLQALGRVGERIRPRHAEGIEAMGARGFLQRALGCGRCQKSRSA